MRQQVNNLFDILPSEQDTELVRILAENAANTIRIEHIISPKNHASEPDTYYDQSQTEFVLLFQGSATLEFPDENPPLVELKPGDHLTIKPHQKHRITKTSPETETIWLTVFY